MRMACSVVWACQCCKRLMTGRHLVTDCPMAQVKLSNMMRVLGGEAVADPTALENQIRAAEAERLQVCPQTCHAWRQAARHVALVPGRP